MKANILRLFHNKGKNLVLPLVFCALSTLAALAALAPVARGLSGGAAAGGFVPVTSIERAPAENTVCLDSQPVPGDALGSLAIGGTAVDCTLYYGDSDDLLKQGAGLYTGAGLPGQGGCVLVGGHTNTYFRDLEKVEVGDEVRLSLCYGEYVYQITDWKIARADDADTYDLHPEQEQLVLYTCYPFGALYETPMRYFLFGRLVSGPTVELP